MLFELDSSPPELETPETSEVKLVPESEIPEAKAPDDLIEAQESVEESEEDTVNRFTILPGGQASLIGEVHVHSISYDDGDNRLPVENLLARTIVVNQTAGLVSVAVDVTTDGFGTLRCTFIGDLQGRAFIMRSDNVDANLTIFRVALSVGVL